MSHEDTHVLDQIDAYLHGVLTHSDSLRVEQHCTVCPICEVAMAEGRRRLDALKALPAVEASDELIAAAEKQINLRRQRPRAWPIIWSTMAAAAAIFAGVHLYVAMRNVSPLDLRILGQEKLI